MAPGSKDGRVSVGGDDYEPIGFAALGPASAGLMLLAGTFSFEALSG